jgi:hypothetical protein
MRDIHILILSMRLHGPEMTLTDLTHQEKALGSIAHYSTIEFYIVTKATIVYKASIYKSLLESALQSYRTL